MQSYDNQLSNTKHWYQSKTIWFNAILGFLALIVSILDPLIPQLEAFMTAENFGLLLASVNLINAVLRKFTHKAIKGGKRE
ncbi:hypothetical protein [Psychrobacter lutiphocae]|uniref:hypothetical protein n=1 Tax=Psychrobacter lutiphocae TaxID=540500 RepID=UPI0003689DD5|nr:hypothetical protein [Psychrobacter lutiphocae]